MPVKKTSIRMKSFATAKKELADSKAKIAAAAKAEEERKVAEAKAKAERLDALAKEQVPAAVEKIIKNIEAKIEDAIKRGSSIVGVFNNLGNETLEIMKLDKNIFGATYNNQVYNAYVFVELIKTLRENGYCNGTLTYKVSGQNVDVDMSKGFIDDASTPKSVATIWYMRLILEDP